MKVESDQLKSSGNICPDDGVAYIVVMPFDHKTLRTGDVVVMRDVANDNCWVRTSDLTVHQLIGTNGEYVIVVPEDSQ